jgi:hypothetical protein
MERLLRWLEDVGSISRVRTESPSTPSTNSSKPVVKRRLPTEPLLEGRDYTTDERGRVVFTAGYLLSRGYCCGNKCRNCPFDHVNVAK